MEDTKSDGPACVLIWWVPFSFFRASGVSILMLKKWNCNFLSIAIEEVSKNRLILRSFSMEQVPSSQEQELLLMMVAGITLGSFICCYVAESEILITLVSSHLWVETQTTHPQVSISLALCVHQIKLHWKWGWCLNGRTCTVALSFTLGKSSHWVLKEHFQAAGDRNLYPLCWHVSALGLSACL